MWHREVGSGAVINTDDSQYQTILALRQSQKDAEAQCAKMTSLERELAEIKELFAQIIKGK